MKQTHQELKQQLENLKKIHHQALHELADAAQIIKSYEFMHELYDSENKRLKEILVSAEEVCATCDLKTFFQKKVELQQNIQEYHARCNMKIAEYSNRAVKPFWNGREKTVSWF